MKGSLITRAPGESWKSHEAGEPAKGGEAQLVIVFGPRDIFDDEAIADLRGLYPSSIIASCSTSGDILGATVSDGLLTAVVLEFERSKVASHLVSIERVEDCYEAGRRIANELAGADLRHVLILSDGQRVNGAQLVRGLNEALPDSVSTSGALAGDGTRFRETLVGLNELPTPGNILGIGFYGKGLRVRCGSGGGWHAFGPERVVTKSNGNVLHELDNEAALAIYKRYLGEQAADLPASALKFPLSMLVDETQDSVVRTILSIDDEQQSMTFAGEVPEGAKVRLMRGFLDDLIEGASEAARSVVASEGTPDFALCISCVGRRIVFGQRVEEELESIESVLGDACVFGMYSYGELGPSGSGSSCQLHNQSICVTTFKEVLNR